MGKQTPANERYFIDPDRVERMGFDWGEMTVTVSPELNGAETCSGGIVVMKPGRGHDRHNHPGAEEIIYVISGTGTQMVEDEAGRPITRDVGPGSTIVVPADRYHSTVNTGSGLMTVLVLYIPAGAEKAMRELADFRPLPPRHMP
jgi:oxalate decarboxylase/phosphoglucose isomerase-like protein (cupin superfamily)